MNDPDFPSGPWIGFYVYANARQKRHRMDLALTFARGCVSGSGSDDIGRFTIQGKFDGRTRECFWTKTYIGAYDVFYRGFREGRGIWGTWELDQSLHAGFHIWPLASGMDLTQSKHNKAQRPVLIPVGTPPKLSPMHGIQHPLSLGHCQGSGDFIAKRRRSFDPNGRDTYAVPWDGEEVVVHWANKDPYFVKTGERFTHYRWQSAVGGRTFKVEFHLTDADLPANNNKDAKKKFHLPMRDKITWDDATSTLIIPFHVRELTAAEKTEIAGGQEEKIRQNLVARSVEKLLAHPQIAAGIQLATALNAPKNDSTGNPRPLLIYHLNRWVRKNESDFFIHKDLHRFLSGELDYYLKSVVLNIDNLLAAGERRAESNFRLLEAVKKLGTEIIDSLAQIENFQKALFEEKKFIVETSWCLTLDRIPAGLKEEVFAAILANDRQ
jgi:hypothetical protein